ncbi:MAG: MucB/RseB C-terminal domain-containing protein [Burkholderiaceae bacterium]
MTSPLVLRRFVAALAALVGAACLMPAAAQTSDDANAEPREQVRAWLTRIHQAARDRNFQGTFVVSGPNGVSSARIAHYAQGPNQFERIESLDGQARTVFRHNDLVHTVWPQERVVMVEQRNLPVSFPALLLAGDDDRIANFYEVRKLGAERVAGYEARVLLVRPRDGYRFGYRLWAEKNTGLLLRADMLGAQDEALETAAFSEVTIGVRPQPETVLHGMRRLEGYRILRPILTSTTLDAEGWTLRSAAPGFRSLSCMRRPLDDYRASEMPAADNQVLQAIFSDGLTHVSIFIEPFDPRRHLRPMFASVGATQTLMRRHADWWVTVVGDVPSATLRFFLGALERNR